MRRQHPVGPYIVDFAILSKRLVIEVDGAVHEFEANKQRDETRDRYLAANGWTVLRVSTNEAMNEAFLLGKITEKLGI
ncbi:MAG: hypothetical protein DHS20C04_29660 [Hyphococcus sp.]|nr:MAG: hypothetical protein DHS20C04_29660 [Marinicaulis sp.]